MRDHVPEEAARVREGNVYGVWLGPLTRPSKFYSDSEAHHYNDTNRQVPTQNIKSPSLIQVSLAPVAAWSLRGMLIPRRWRHVLLALHTRAFQSLRACCASPLGSTGELVVCEPWRGRAE